MHVSIQRKGECAPLGNLSVGLKGPVRDRMEQVLTEVKVQTRSPYMTGPQKDVPSRSVGDKTR